MASSNEDDLLYSHAAVRLAVLIHKSREKQPLVKEEQQELEDWLNDHPSNTMLFDLLHDRAQLVAEVEALMLYDENKAVSDVFRSLGQRPPSTIQRRRTTIRRWSVAASLLLVTSVASWFFIRRTESVGPATPSMAGMRSDDSKAVLTLADGQQVMLDGIHTRVLGMQGAARVVQQQGRLVYTAGSNGPVAWNTITTPKGGRYRLRLADGSEVWLNAASSVTYPSSFAGDTREVTITGEAYFNVAKDKTKPFFVTARAMKVQVVGTEFDVMAYPDEDAIRTTLVQGLVKAGNTKGQELTLQPGEQAALVHRSGLMRREKPDMNEVTAWRSGVLRFHETNMAAIMRQITRWYDVKLEYRGPVDNIGFTGELSRKEHVQELLDILSDTRNIHFEIKDDKTIVVIPGHK